VNITADVPLKLKNPVDSTDLSEAVKEYTIPSRQSADGISVPISPVTLVDATKDPIRQYSAFDWDSIPMTIKTGADPAIEVEPSNSPITIAAGKRFVPYIAYMTLVASADAANRTMELYISDGTAIVYKAPIGLTITAGQTRTQTWVLDSLIVAAGTQYAMHIPHIEMMAGWRAYVYIAGFDVVAAGDNATALTIYGKEAPA